tara:strand:+ start:573 stop:3662 length:3090 start_codon:yes stop_codon:yes gene_type:complete
MCYRDAVPTLNFNNIHVACLSGNNGHGKSALLDSITWALWGQSRTRTQDELIHQGLTDMMVELEFAARSQTYKVSRRYSRRGKQSGTTILEFLVSSNGSFKPITGNTVRDTETRIKEILNMDYETFVNTAFLLQGKADLFTSSSPNKRKEVLAEVLDLSYYEILENRARDHSQLLQEQIQRIESDSSVRIQEIQEKPRYEQELLSANSNLSNIKLDLENGRLEFQIISDKITILKNKKQELDNLEQRLIGTEIEIADLTRRLEQDSAKLKQSEDLISRENEITSKFDELNSLQKEMNRLDEAGFKETGLTKEISSTNIVIESHQSKLLLESDQIRTRIDEELEPKSRSQKKIEEEIRIITKSLKEQTANEKQFNDKKDEANLLWEELVSINKSLEIRRGLEDQKAKLEQKIAVEEAQLSEQISQLGKTIIDLESKVAEISHLNNEIVDLSKEHALAKKQLDKGQTSRRDLEQFGDRINYLKQENSYLHIEMQETREKFDLLTSGKAECPVCKQIMETEGINKLKQEYRDKGLEHKKLYSKNKQECEELIVNQEELSKQIEFQDQETTSLILEINQKLSTCQSKLDEANKSVVHLANIRKSYQGLSETIKLKNFASTERLSLQKISEQISGLEYSPESLSHKQEAIAKLEKIIERDQEYLIKRRQQLENSMILSENKLSESISAGQELVDKKQQLEHTNQKISQKDYLPEEQAKIKLLQDRLAELNYDRGYHKEVLAKVNELNPYIELNRQCQNAKTTLDSQKTSLQSSSKLLARRSNEIETDKHRCLRLKDDLQSLVDVEQKYTLVKNSLSILEKSALNAEVAQKTVQQQIARIDNLQTEIAELQSSRKKITESKSIYDELRLAFGRNGIQALIIENTIPQIQDEANELLGRLTENRMFLKLQLKEGRRDKQIGLRAEEIDIRVSDEIGTRSYETFSGGESFRINFALRIALSKLLARRAGTPLPILFIDEGFGSQDNTGQERLREAIQSIQDDFEKIIVITHLEQIKEAFPVRIEVTKTTMGSTFEII